MAETTYDPGGLIAGDFPVKTRTVTIDSGQDLVRGTVLGLITADDEYVISETASEDDSEIPVAVLAEDVDASDGPVDAPAYVTGEFAADKLVFGADHDKDTVEESWRVAGLPLFVIDRV